MTKYLIKTYLPIRNGDTQDVALVVSRNTYTKYRFFYDNETSDYDCKIIHVPYTFLSDRLLKRFYYFFRNYTNSLD